MSSERQVEANRNNAQLSTGPRTADGKAQTASNALRHGLTSRKIVLPNENPEDFESFRIGLLGSLNPNDELEGIFAERIVVDAWRLRRVPGLEAALYRRGEQFEIEVRSGQTDPTVIATRSLERYSESFANLWRHEAALSRSWLRNLHELQRLQAIRGGERVPAPAVVDVDVSMKQDGAVNLEATSRKQLPSADPLTAQVEPAPSSAQDSIAQVSFFITNSQKTRLRGLGFSDKDIAKMKPEEAHRILGLA
jgi:hypothetical protein